MWLRIGILVLEGEPEPGQKFWIPGFINNSLICPRKCCSKTEGRMKKVQFDKYYQRHWQGSNLRGITPMDFKSIALTTRPQCRVSVVLTCIYDHATHLSSQTPPLFPPIPPLPYLILHLIFLFFWILFIATQLEASTPVCMFDPTSSFQDTFTWITASTRQYCE